MILEMLRYLRLPARLLLPNFDSLRYLRTLLLDISEPNVCWFVRIFMSADGGSYRKENIADYIEL